MQTWTCRLGAGAAVINDQLTVYLELKGHVDGETKSFEKKIEISIGTEPVRENYERRHV